MESPSFLNYHGTFRNVTLFFCIHICEVSSRGIYESYTMLVVLLKTSPYFVITDSKKQSMDFIKLVVFRSRVTSLAEGVGAKGKPVVPFSPPELMIAYLSKLIVIGRYDVFYDRRKLNEPLYFADFMRLL